MADVPTIFDYIEAVLRERDGSDPLAIAKLNGDRAAKYAPQEKGPNVVSLDEHRGRAGEKPRQAGLGI